MKPLIDEILQIDDARGSLVLRFFAAVETTPRRWRVAATVIGLVLAFTLRSALTDGLGERAPYFTFYPVIAFAALVLGTSGGVAAVIFAVVATHAPIGAWRINSFDHSGEILILGVFLFNSATLIILAWLLRVLGRERRVREELVRVNAEQLGHFVEQAPAAMAMFDRDMRYIAASARWRDDFALSRDLVGKSHYDVFPEMGEDWKAVHRRALAGERVKCDADRFVRLDGAAQWLRWEVRPWRHPRDGVGGVLIFSEDISERMRAEAALRDNEMRLNAIVDAAMEAIISIDSGGVIQSANPATVEMLGYAVEEMLGRNVKMLMPNPYREEHDGYLSAYLRTGDKKIIGLRRKVEGRRKDGAVFPLELTVSEGRVDGRALFVGFLRDLSPVEEEKRRVNSLREELRHVSRLNDMGEMVAGLAHEVAQPIAAILNFSAAHRRAMATTGETLEPDLIAKIETQARRAAEILKRLRGYIEKRPPERKPEQIDELIDEAIKLWLRRSRAHVAHLRQADDSGGTDVFVDRIQIGQVLVNLLRNADDALVDRAEPEILIETTLIEPDKVRVSVADNGEGVDPETVDELFNPFYSTKKFGMGVGLSIARAIVEGHGGVLAYRANAPSGSIFEFTLPVYRGPERPDRAARAETSPMTSASSS